MRFVFLLGLIRGRCNLGTRGKPPDLTAEERTKVNTGIATVTPFDEVLAVLNREDPVEQRRRDEEAELVLHAPEEDAAIGEGGEGQPGHGPGSRLSRASPPA
jgi:hypothetical protein